MNIALPLVVAAAGLRVITVSGEPDEFSPPRFTPAGSSIIAAVVAFLSVSYAVLSIVEMVVR